MEGEGGNKRKGQWVISYELPGVSVRGREEIARGPN